MNATSYRTDTAGAPVAELVITRLLDAPQALAFKVWTDPAHVAQWWGPRGFTNPVCELDPQPGGRIRIHMVGDDGTVIPVDGVVSELLAPERFVFVTTAFPDSDGVPQIEVLNIVTFADESGKTRMTLRALVMRGTPDVAESLAGMEQGWNESLDKLEEELARVQEEEA